MAARGSAIPETPLAVALEFDAFHPVVDLLFRLGSVQAISLLKPPEELLALAGDDIEVIVGELPPLLPDLPFDLLPLPFD